MMIALCESCDCHAIQTEVAREVIEKKLSKARKRIDEYATIHTNLLLLPYLYESESDLECSLTVLSMGNTINKRCKR